MARYHPLIVNLFPTAIGHEGLLTWRLPGRPLILEVRHWHKVSHHVEAEMRLDIGDDTGPMDPEMAALVRGLSGWVEG